MNAKEMNDALARTSCTDQEILSFMLRLVAEPAETVLDFSALKWAQTMCFELFNRYRMPVLHDGRFIVSNAIRALEDFDRRRQPSAAVEAMIKKAMESAR